VWPAVIAAFTWPAVIDAFKWPDSLAFSWSNWIKPLNWASFVSWLGIPGGGGGGSGGGAGNRPENLNPDDPRPQSFPGRNAPIVSPLSAAGMGGVTIILENVTVANGMDIEVLAAQLAKRFQQKMRA
jgi:hypothetical protein